MSLSPFHIYAKARELAGYITEEGKLLPVFASSNINIYPYQVAAALFALRSPFLKGVILADEGSLGKTFEALLIAAQRWYEGRDKQLIVLPTNLIKQWSEKIRESFTLPFVVIDTDAKYRSFEDNPFEQEAIIITTYDFAVNHIEAVEAVKWDLVIFDEASIFAKSYTGDNKSSTLLKRGTEGAFRVLLTPTPLTMSIMDIYGLLWFIDESILPDEKWFYGRYFRKPENYHELSGWVSKYCFRTLKSQVSEYVNFTNRLPYTLSCELSDGERELYDKLNNYLARPTKLAYPKMEQYELTLMLHHTLSSSAQAFAKTIEGAINRIDDGEEREFLKGLVISCQWLEISSKMRKLLEVIKTVFKKLTTNHYPLKTIIFTDNRTTQSVLQKLLINNGYGTLTYNGSNSRDYSVMEQFRTDKSVKILVATDDAAKGLDIEFCPVVINYDLLYNSIDMEQRIARCHRQGGRSDVLVVNLLYKDNFADVRILELVNKRVLQFDGIFGMSDSLLGNFDADIDDVLSQIRPLSEIESCFADNLSEHKQQNKELVDSTETTLFTSFTREIASKVYISPDYIEDKITTINKELWSVVSWYFNDYGEGYVVDEREQTITAPDGELPVLFYYWSGTRNRPYKSLKKYGMSDSFKPNSGRITLTSVLGRNILDEVYCQKEGQIKVDADIEPCTIGYYGITVNSKLHGESITYYTYIGVTESGKSLSDDDCRAIMALPVVSYKEKFDNQTRCNHNSRIFVVANDVMHPLDSTISTDDCMAKYGGERDGVVAEQVDVIKRQTAIAKSRLERGGETLRGEIKSAEKELSVAKDRLSKIKADKLLKLLRRDLQRFEDSLFMEGMRLDVELQQQIESISDKQQLTTTVQRHFLIEIKGK